MNIYLLDCIFFNDFIPQFLFPLLCGIILLILENYVFLTTVKKNAIFNLGVDISQLS